MGEWEKGEDGARGLVVEGVRSVEAPSKVLEECCGELEPSKEEFDIFSWRLRFSLEEKSEKYKRNEG